VTADDQYRLGFGHRPALAEQDFLEAPCNARALAWIRRWPDWPGPALAVYGPAGCGKTHLAAIWRRRAGAVSVGPRVLRETSPPDLLAAAGACVIDDAEAVGDEETLLHLFNLFAEAKGWLLMTSRCAPARWGVALADLRSRLGAIPAVAVGAPDDALMAAVLVKLFADRQLRVGREVVAFAAARMERSFEAARRLVAAADDAALAARREITVPLLREVLGRLEGGGEAPG
jgi:chromosomal replication initiation ATPase DnaA